MIARRSDITQEGPPVRGISYADFVHEALLRRLKALLENEDEARRGEDVEALHDMRVASRRLRAALRVFTPYLPDRHERKGQKALRKVTRVLGTTREWDVHAEVLAKLHAATTREVEKAAVEHVMELVSARRAVERQDMGQALDGLRLDKVGRTVRWLAEHVRARGSPDDVPHAAWEALNPLIDDASANIDALRASEHPEELHRLRIGLKRLRYALELLTPAFADGPPRMLARAKELQEILGQHHDLCLLEDLLTRTLTRLTEHGRALLAGGLIGPIECLRADRHARYRDFIAASAGLSAGGVRRELRTGLELDLDGERVAE